jgi:hypothetical protein
MIDFEKIKKAINLAQMISKQESIYIHIDIQIGDSDEFLSFGFLDPNEQYKYWFHNIDDLIAKLEELIKPESKYEVGQTIWFIDSENEICSLIIEHINFIDGIIHYCQNSKGWMLPESERLYSSKEALIQDQIDYWRLIQWIF